MAKRRELLVQAGASVLALPGLARRTLAHEGAQTLPLPDQWRLGPEGSDVLEARVGNHAFDASIRTTTQGFGQPFLGPLLRVQRGRSARVSVRNRLREPITVHWHGLHVPGAVDGGPHSEIAPGSTWSPTLEIDQPAATLWYHSHVHGRTGPQVYGGLAGLLIVDDPGAPTSGLPSNYGVDDLPLMLQDRAFLADGRMAYSNRGPAMMAGFRGDRIVVNGALDARARVPAGIVRLRIANGSNARTYHLHFDDGRALHLIGSDGGLLPKPVPQRRITLSSGERAEVLVDFGDRGDARLLSAPDLNSPMMGGMMGGAVQPRPVADRGAFEVLRFVVDKSAPVAVREVPVTLAAAAPLPTLGEPVRRRRFVLDSHGMGMMGMTINGRAFDMDRIDLRARRGETELWQVQAGDMAHPFHVHGTSFQLLSRNGAAVDFASTGWKDTVLVDDVVQLLVRFDHRADEKAPYMFHCHILEHEDAGMMGQFTVS